MKRKGAVGILTAIAMLTTSVAVMPSAVYAEAAVAAQENMIANGDFSEGLGTWSNYQETGTATQTVDENGQMVVDITNIGKVDYAVQVYYDGFEMKQGCKYRLAFDAQSTVARTIQWRVQINGGDYHAYASDIVEIGTEPTHIEAVFTMEEPTDPAPRFCVNLGVQEGCPEGLNEHTITFDNFELNLMDSSNAAAEEAEEESAGILLNQVGYLPGAAKRAVVRAQEGVTSGEVFKIVNEKGESVYQRELSEAVQNESSGEELVTADFSELTEPGVYTLKTADGLQFASFVIGEDVYDSLEADAMRMFYLQRCGEVIDETFGHEACHQQDAEIYGSDGQTLQTLGGWHDAGDYGRYVVAGAKAAADLLLAYENYGEQFADTTGIPESGNGIADLLDEVKTELDWMLTMQDSESGGVYHKVTGEVFPGVIMPQEETAQMIVAPISTTATADFAAVMAMAARIYPEEEFRQTCLSAAEKAWKYLEITPSDGVGFLNPEGIVTGQYEDSKDADERFWAAAELYRTTAESSYAEAAQQMNPEEIAADLGWQGVGAYGLYAYLMGAEENDAFAQTIRDRLLAIADGLVQKSNADVYGVALSKDDYIWGSNMSVANDGMLLLMAEQVSGDEAYRRAAEQQLNYLLGTNTTGYSFVTGYGEKPAEHPHHRPSQAQGTAVKGMLVGGPNANLEDPYAKQVLADNAPAACYADSDQSYSTNEVAIYWNSPLLYLVAGVRGK